MKPGIYSRAVYHLFIVRKKTVVQTKVLFSSLYRNTASKRRHLLKG